MPADGSVDLRSQLLRHLESLQAAGVLFVPRPVIVPLQVAQLTNQPVVTQPALRVDPLESRRHELALLAAGVANCDRCSELYSTRTQTVFGSGPLDAEIAFVGEAPGAAEDAQGEPFAGKGGEVLSRIIAACGFTREQVYLTYAIKCRPPKNRTPSTTECENCREYLDRQFELVKPKYLVTLGPFVSRLLTGNLQGKLRGMVHDYRGVPLICTHHADDLVIDEQKQSEAEIATAVKRKRETWDDMQLLLRTMGRAVPGGK